MLSWGAFSSHERSRRSPPCAKCRRRRPTLFAAASGKAFRLSSWSARWLSAIALITPSRRSATAAGPCRATRCAFGPEKRPHGLCSNPWLWLEIGLSILLHVAVIYMPFMQQASSTVSLQLERTTEGMVIRVKKLILCYRKYKQCARADRFSNNDIAKGSSSEE